MTEALNSLIRPRSKSIRTQERSCAEYSTVILSRPTRRAAVSAIMSSSDTSYLKDPLSTALHKKMLRWWWITSTRFPVPVSMPVHLYRCLNPYMVKRLPQSLGSDTYRLRSSVWHRSSSADKLVPIVKTGRMRTNWIQSQNRVHLQLHQVPSNAACSFSMRSFVYSLAEKWLVERLHLQLWCLRSRDCTVWSS